MSATERRAVAGALPGPSLPAKSYVPSTFLSRGVAVPFTTPPLAGTRVRPPERGTDLELVVPNPSGGRGMYVVSWSGVDTICQPTLHDRELHRRIVDETTVLPSTIRRVSRLVAAEGLAGADARDAATEAEAMDENELVSTNFRLLMTLVEQVGLTPGLSQTLKLEHASEQAKQTVDHVSATLGRTNPWTANALEEIAKLFVPLGLGDGTESARIPCLLASLRDVRMAVEEWSRSEIDGSFLECASLVCTVADTTLTMAGPVLEEARALTGKMVGLLRAWAEDPAIVIRRTTRPEWLLDGWEHICLIWSAADGPAAQRAAVAEMANLVPVLPQEAIEWSSAAAEVNEKLRFRKVIRLHEDWYTGTLDVDMIARNERLRAASVLPAPQAASA